MAEGSPWCAECDGAGAVWDGDELVPCTCVLDEDMPRSEPTNARGDDADDDRR